jgi:hypothetical protein
MPFRRSPPLTFVTMASRPPALDWSIQTPFARRTVDAAIVWAGTEQAVGTQFTCLDCGSGLSRRAGVIRRAHFAHRAGALCGGGGGDGGGGGGGGGEGPRHHAAKHFLSFWWRQVTFEVPCPRCHLGLLRLPLSGFGASAFVEEAPFTTVAAGGERGPTFVVDVMGVDAAGRHMVAVEVTDTHETGAHKWAALQDHTGRDGACFDVQAADVEAAACSWANDPGSDVVIEASAKHIGAGVTHAVCGPCANGLLRELAPATTVGNLLATVHPFPLHNVRVKSPEVGWGRGQAKRWVNCVARSTCCPTADAHPVAFLLATQRAGPWHGFVRMVCSGCKVANVTSRLWPAEAQALLEEPYQAQLRAERLQAQQQAQLRAERLQAEQHERREQAMAQAKAQASAHAAAQAKAHAEAQAREQARAAEMERLQERARQTALAKAAEHERLLATAAAERAKEQLLEREYQRERDHQERCRRLEAAEASAEHARLWEARLRVVMARADSVECAWGPACLQSERSAVAREQWDAGVARAGSTPDLEARFDADVLHAVHSMRAQDAPRGLCPCAMAAAEARLNDWLRSGNVPVRASQPDVILGAVVEWDSASSQYVCSSGAEFISALWVDDTMRHLRDVVRAVQSHARGQCAAARAGDIRSFFGPSAVPRGVGKRPRQ